MITHSTTARRPSPAPILDALAFGLQAGILPHRAGLPGQIRARLIEAGHVCKADQHPNRIVFEVPIAGGVDKMTCELVFSESDRGVNLSQNSELRLNPLRAISASSQRAPSLDGNDNYLGATAGREDEILTAQYATVRDAIDSFTEILSAALPDDVGFVDQRMWLRSAEACADIEAKDAPEVARWLQRAALPGATQTIIDGYRVAGVFRKLHAALRWWRQETGPCFKAYAKTDTLLRAEIACPDRRSLRVLGCGESAEVDGMFAIDLLSHFLNAVTPMLHEVVAHVEAARAGSPFGISVVLRKLYPLIHLATGGTKAAGRPPSADTFMEASRALSELFTRGSFCASGHRRGTTLRTVLEEMCGADGVLTCLEGGSVYSLNPKYARAATTIARRL